jgi:hypothetical protein
VEGFRLDHFTFSDERQALATTSAINPAMSAAMPFDIMAAEFTSSLVSVFAFHSFSSK